MYNKILSIVTKVVREVTRCPSLSLSWYLTQKYYFISCLRRLAWVACVCRLSTYADSRDKRANWYSARSTVEVKVSGLGADSNLLRRSVLPLYRLSHEIAQTSTPCECQVWWLQCFLRFKMADVVRGSQMKNVDSRQIIRVPFFFRYDCFY